jgi:hypothetical protein
MGKIVESRGLYEYVSDNGIVYEIGANGADFNIIIDSSMDYDDIRDEFFGPFNYHMVDYVMGEIEDPDVIEWIDERIERYENHERILKCYDGEFRECYIGLKEEKHETSKRVSKEELFAKRK